MTVFGLSSIFQFFWIFTHEGDWPIIFLLQTFLV